MLCALAGVQDDAAVGFIDSDPVRSLLVIEGDAGELADVREFGEIVGCEGGRGGERLDPVVADALRDGADLAVEGPEVADRGLNRVRRAQGSFADRRAQTEVGDGNSLMGWWLCWRVWGPSTARGLALRVHTSLRVRRR